MKGEGNPSDILSKHWGYTQIWPTLRPLLFASWSKEAEAIRNEPKGSDKIQSITTGTAQEKCAPNDDSAHGQTASEDGNVIQSQPIIESQKESFVRSAQRSKQPETGSKMVSFGTPVEEGNSSTSSSVPRKDSGVDLNKPRDGTTPSIKNMLKYTYKTSTKATKEDKTTIRPD
jgi:hypothetical protein